jgi:glutaredoxin
MDNYVVYGRSTCPFCKKAIKLLEKRQEKHVFVDLAEEPQVLSETKRFYKWKTVPIVIQSGPTGNKFIGGFNELRKHFE